VTVSDVVLKADGKAVLWALMVTTLALGGTAGAL
jgi:hypothetical protein